MTKFARKCNIRVLSALFVAMICLFAIFAFVGCDKKETVAPATYGIYLKGYAYDEQTLTVTAHVALSGTSEQRLSGLTAAGERRAFNENLFYRRTNIRVELDAPSIYSAVREGMTQEVWVKDQTHYENLKVVMRYDTIYKSIVTNGTRHSVSGGYVDLLELGEDGPQEFLISQRSQNSANWYSLLVAAGIAALAAGLAIYLAVAHKKEKRQTSQEVAYAEEERN